MSLRSINKNKKKIESILTSLEIKNSSMELIDKSILFFAINEMLFGNLDKPVAIDESLRLSKKFSSPESYKFINVSLDKFFKTLS
jgi:N utilization substance protein B